MIVKNFLETEGDMQQSHQGEGLVSNVKLFSQEEFETNLTFIIYTEIPPGSSIGYHQHGANEEVYVVLEGRGIMNTNGELREVHTGDVILNKPGWSHGLKNTFDEILRILVFEVNKEEFK